MNATPVFTTLAGIWTGTYRLQVEPSGPVRESPTTAKLSSVAGGGFTRLDYTWEYDGRPQDGSLLVGYDAGVGKVVAVWVDSWHMSESMLRCEGHAKDGAVELLGSYPAPPGPDWGWRTVVAAEGATLRMTMYNVTPDGQEFLAVEAVYRRGG